MKWQRVFIVCLLAVMVCLLTACGTVSYSVQITTGGARKLTLMVQFDEDATAEERAQAEAFLRSVCDARNRAGRRCTVKVADGAVAMEEQFESATDYYVAMGYTGDEPNEDETPYVNLNAYFTEYRSDMQLLERPTVVGYQWQYAVACDVAVVFEWRTHCMALSATDSALQPLYAELAATATDRVAEATLAALSGSYGDALAEDLTSWLAERGYDLAAVDFRYTYEHLYRSVYAKDCTKSYRNPDTGSMVYEWDATLAEVPTMQISIYQKAPRVWVWELTAVAAGVLVMVALSIVILVKRRNNHAPRE